MQEAIKDILEAIPKTIQLINDNWALAVFCYSGIAISILAAIIKRIKARFWHFDTIFWKTCVRNLPHGWAIFGGFDTWHKKRLVVVVL